MTIALILNTRPLFDLEIGVGPIENVGGPPGAQRRVGPLTGGNFKGERLEGTVLAGGADWQTVRGDGAVLLDARTILRTGDGATIATIYEGIRHGPPDVMARLGTGESVDPASYYFRITAKFETSAPRYEWMNRIIAAGVGHRLPEGPIYRLFEII
jgi:hypothetical protein